MRCAGGMAGLLAALALAAAVSGCATPGDQDVTDVLEHVQAAWLDYNQCAPAEFCNSYFDSFGVALMFADGSTQPLAHVRRLDASAHDCIENAKDALASGDRALAVQWVMASQHSAAVREWMRQHPDAVLDVLRTCCSS